MTSSPEMFIKKSINFLSAFHFPKMFTNLVLRDRLVCPTYCIPQPFSLHVRTYITSFEFQSKSESLTTENCLLLTFEIIVLLQLRYLQQMQLFGIALGNGRVHSKCTWHCIWKLTGTFQMDGYIPNGRVQTDMLCETFPLASPTAQGFLKYYWRR